MHINKIISLAAFVITIQVVHCVNHQFLNYILLHPFAAKQESSGKLDRSFSNKYTRSYERNDLHHFPSLIFDYAKTIQNDIIMFDNTISMQYKRNNDEQKEKVSGHQLIDGQGKYHSLLTCGSCVQNATIIKIGSHHYPEYATNVTCNTESNSCMWDFRCVPKIYDLLVLKKRCNDDPEHGIVPLPPALRNYLFVIKPIVIDCQCVYTGQDSGKNRIGR